MKKIHSIILGILAIFIFIIFHQSPAQSTNIKEPNVSGRFYPSAPYTLTNMIDNYLKAAQPPEISGTIYGLISPHAGYIYSGPVAAYGYKTIAEKSYKTVVIISPSHYKYLTNAVVYKTGAFQTPLGNARIDSSFTAKLLKLNTDIVQMPSVFEKEHALEVQIPFLQRTLKNFKIVPIIMGNNSYDLCNSLAESLAAIIKDRDDVLIIASSDMSHYHDQEKAKAIDEQTMDIIKSFDTSELLKKTAEKEIELCGSGPVATLLLTMEKMGVSNIQKLNYATSWDTMGSNKNKVVGYCSFVFSKRRYDMLKENMLSEIQKNKLLVLARQSIREFVTHRQHPRIVNNDPDLTIKQGAFVTIKKNGQLRGCIGRIIADTPLINTVSEVAIQAATEDPRFPPLKEDELDQIHLEISVMSPLKLISNIDEIEVGKHGLIIRKGFSSGLLLPQVATEYNWSKEEFLEHTCMKAGLRSDEWKNNAQMYIFSAEVFGEKE
ncbi:MAG: AmmeMemoRadiSam system protein B [PVC group bacterium]|nr:AmmeMemoRadiSam system protein B [PVC group bacterium]